MKNNRISISSQNEQNDGWTNKMLIPECKT